MPVALPPLYHVGVVVSDLDAAVADYRRRWGAPLDRTYDMTFSGALVHGRPAW